MKEDIASIDRRWWCEKNNSSALTLSLVGVVAEEWEREYRSAPEERVSRRRVPQLEGNESMVTAPGNHGQAEIGRGGVHIAFLTPHLPIFEILHFAILEKISKKFFCTLLILQNT